MTRFFLRFDELDNIIQIYASKIYGYNNNNQIHIPILMGDDLIEQGQNRIIRVDGIHIIYFDYVSGPVQDVICCGVRVSMVSTPKKNVHIF